MTHIYYSNHGLLPLPVVEKPRVNQFTEYAINGYSTFDGASYNDCIAAYNEWLSPAIVVPDEFKGAFVEGREYTVTNCESCGGDGKETCNNPDHGFISAVGGEINRLGCPVCGHDPNHKVYGGGKCEDCNGLGFVAIPLLPASKELEP